MARGTGNRYILTVVDQFSRFPWAFPTPDQSSETVIDCLTELIAIGGAPQCIHSDQGSAFMSAKVKQFLDDFDITSTQTTPYNPQGNGQCEKFNGIIWKAVRTYMEDNEWSDGLWEEALPHALHSI